MQCPEYNTVSKRNTDHTLSLWSMFLLMKSELQLLPSLLPPSLSSSPLYFSLLSFLSHTFYWNSLWRQYHVVVKSCLNLDTFLNFLKLVY